MKRILSLFVILLSVFAFNACTVNNVTIDDEIGGILEKHNVKGTFGMFDNSRGTFTVYDLDRFKQNYAPGQTFNIVSTMVALHTGKLTDDSSMVKANDSSGSSLNIYTAFRANSTPHFETVASLIGKDTMKFWVDSLKYGNRKIGNDLQHFWMNDSLQISADEQLGLIKRLYFKQHPIRASVQESLKKMLIVENNAQFQTAYQLGSVRLKGRQLGWVVGWVEENRHVYPFVINFDAGAEADTNAIGKQLMDDILAHIGFFKGIM
jgi:beta-lactamase class D